MKADKLELLKQAMIAAWEQWTKNTTGENWVLYMDAEREFREQEREAFGKKLNERGSFKLNRPIKCIIGVDPGKGKSLPEQQAEVKPVNFREFP